MAIEIKIPLRCRDIGFVNLRVRCVQEGHDIDVAVLFRRDHILASDEKNLLLLPVCVAGDGGGRHALPQPTHTREEPKVSMASPVLSWFLGEKRYRYR